MYATKLCKKRVLNEKKSFFLFFNQRLRELKGQSYVESKTDFFCKRAASLLCCFSSQLNAIKMFNLSCFFSPFWRVIAAATMTTSRWKRNSYQEMSEHERKKGSNLSSKSHGLKSQSSPIWYLYFLMFLGNRRNASTSNVM